MATMNLNTWLEQVVFPGTDLNWDLWGKLSPAEQNQILGSFNTNLQGLSDPTKIQEAMNKGSFDYVSEQERGQQGSDWMGDMLLKGLTAATIGGGLGGFENLLGEGAGAWASPEATNLIPQTGADLTGGAGAWASPEVTNLVPQTGANLTGETAASLTDADYGNWDMGHGPTGTDPFTGGGAATATTSLSGIPPGSGSALSRIWDQLNGGGKASTADWLSLGGNIAGPLLGYYGANKQAKSYSDLMRQIQDERQPFLDYSKNLLAGGPEAYAAGPGAGAVKGILQGLSVHGNPFGNPGDLMRGSSQLGQLWQNAVQGIGGMGLGGQGIQAQLGGQVIGAQGGALSAIGSGIENIFNPRMSLVDLLRVFQQQTGKNEIRISSSGLG